MNLIIFIELYSDGNPMGWDGMRWDRKICPMDKPEYYKAEVCNSLFVVLYLLNQCAVFVESCRITSKVNQLQTSY